MWTAVSQSEISGGDSSVPQNLCRVCGICCHRVCFGCRVPRSQCTVEGTSTSAHHGVAVSPRYPRVPRRVHCVSWTGPMCCGRYRSVTSELHTLPWVNLITYSRHTDISPPPFPRKKAPVKPHWPLTLLLRSWSCLQDMVGQRPVLLSSHAKCMLRVHVPHNES